MEGFGDETSYIHFVDWHFINGISTVRFCKAGRKTYIGARS
ncbi:hypothetical protein BB65665_13351 [Bacillus sp. 916]|nr:hypothetical protein KSO_008605 [Bacillus amyloliquefaciens IT-45]EJD66954.1 hypothetical protein BB65665_13351 [Bacillus sp. 916]